jgi:GT2 family glycosyltransferase
MARRTSRSARIAALGLLVQTDAFRSAPLLYLQGIAWRIRGLRVRSRNRLAVLAGRSPHAYALWIAQRERIEAQSQTAGPEIWPIVDCRRGCEGLPETLASIAEAGSPASPILIGGEPAEGTHHIRSPGNIRALFKEPNDAWLLPLRPGDRLARNAFAAYATAAAKAHTAWVMYADDDLISNGRRSKPHFKPDWNPELFEHHDYVSGSCILRFDFEADELPAGDDWIEAATRLAIAKAPPLHLRQVLHHRRARPLPIVPARPADMSRRALPPVTTIIPTRNGLELLRTSIEGVRQTVYGSIETIVVDNGTDDPATLAYLKSLEREGATILRMPGPFNYSTLNNAAVEHATGELLCFLNNDVKIMDDDWLALLAQHAVKPDMGAVGARLLYPDGSIQHAGVFTGIGGGAGHAHRYQKADTEGYFSRARLPQRVSAVTAACMVVEKRKFLAVGGFDEVRFPVAFNDVDLCMKLNSRGWQSFYEPRATLIHHESKTRGADRSKEKRARFARELATLKQVWGTDKACDPYHHPSLSPFCEEFLVRL